MELLLLVDDEIVADFGPKLWEWEHLSSLLTRLTALAREQRWHEAEVRCSPYVYTQIQGHLAADQRFSHEPNGFMTLTWNGLRIQPTTMLPDDKVELFRYIAEA